MARPPACRSCSGVHRDVDGAVLCYVVGERRSAGGADSREGLVDSAVDGVVGDGVGPDAGLVRAESARLVALDHARIATM